MQEILNSDLKDAHVHHDSINLMQPDSSEHNTFRHLLNKWFGNVQLSAW